jgi:hypothetical protein
MSPGRLQAVCQLPDIIVRHNQRAVSSALSYLCAFALILTLCSVFSSIVRVQAMRKLLNEGAVPDTWAPNGSSALMLAAAANSTEALKVGVMGQWMHR